MKTQDHVTPIVQGHSKLVVWGKWVTIGYLALIVIYAFAMWPDIIALKANEFGDLLAGVFAPLALAWLVLGFFQQGQELRASTTALQMQAEELRASVEQQQRMVEITQQQLEYERTRAEAAEAEADRLSRPKWSIDIRGSQVDNLDQSKMAYAFILMNSGAGCTDFEAIYQGKAWKQLKVVSGERILIQLSWQPGDGDEQITINYTDARGLPRNDLLTLRATPSALVWP